MTALETLVAGLPALYCPLRPSVHSGADAIDTAAVRWMRQWDIPVDRARHEALLGSRSAAFVANVSPTAPADRLELYREIACAVRDTATAAQYARWVSAYRIYYQHIPWEISNRLRGRGPTLAEQILIRITNTGCAAMFAMLEICNVTELPAPEAADPALRALVEAGALLLGWANDLLSFAREARESPAQQNLITVLMAERQLSPQHAAAEAIGLWNRVMVLFLRLREQLLTRASDPLRQCLYDFTSMLGNVAAWHTGNPRYTTTTDTGPAITGDPAGIDPAPLPFPVIAWWWDQLDTPDAPTVAPR